MLNKFGIGSFTNNMIEELNNCRVLYNNIDNIDTDKVSSTKTKKKILGAAFECLCGIFHFDYDEKLRFNSESRDPKYIFLYGFENLSFDDAFYALYFECFYKYLDRLHMSENPNIDNKIYTISRLACIGFDYNILHKLSAATFKALLNSKLDIEFNKEVERITSQELENLATNCGLRQEALMLSVLNYHSGEIDNNNIRNVYKCFSSDVFSKFTAKEKLHVMDLLYCYFNNDVNKKFKRKHKNNVNENTSNKEALELVIKELLKPGNTMIIKRKNMDMVKDILSGLPYIYANESQKENLYKLDDLIALANINKR